MQVHKQLFREQLKSWMLAADNYHALSKAVFKEYLMDGFRIRLQFNPGRLVSSSANISKDVILARPCFLCEKNRPAEQYFMPFEVKDLNTKFQILVNPFPVFPQHFTIASTEHQLQAINGQFYTLLKLAEKLDDCVVFYNGPRCGASAPDHLHFQAGSKGLMPIESDYDQWKESHLSTLYKGNGVQLFKMEHFLRNGWMMEGNNLTELVYHWELLLEILKSVEPETGVEPMLNLLCWYSEGKWICAIFPRKSHRPKCYFKEDDSKLMISPASVEMGGLMIAARQEDFERITAENIQGIYNDVSLSKTEIDILSDLFLNKMSL